MEHQIVCFGEMLWDMLPTGKLPGGALMNVAIHLQHHGYSPVLVSCVGDDQLGQELLSFLDRQQVTTQWVQTASAHPTGLVKVNLQNPSEVTYDIVEYVAWDYIEYQEKVAHLITQSEVLVYGSLASRARTFRETLHRYLLLAKSKVFDVNLRPPFCAPEDVLALLAKATVVKMNQEELSQVCGWLGIVGDAKGQMQGLLEKFTLDLVLVTRGEKGAAVVSQQTFLEHPGYPVPVEDTIGSGDAFLAAFLANYLQNASLEQALEKACLVGAYVATQRGATPSYQPHELSAGLLMKGV